MSTTQAPHKHPVMDRQCKCGLPMKEHGHGCHPRHRPHMGDMTGWRFLDMGFDVRTQGDECISLLETADHWSMIKGGFNRAYFNQNDAAHTAYRRRLPDSPKPADQKQFVTMTFEVPSGVEVPNWLYKDVPELQGLRCVTMAVGDIIEAHHGLADRAIEAVKKAFREGAV